ncbi:DUF4194 domain-containing protein [Nocardiopsis synnemataformans]|uniref:DUF4194 domain-containing protein n=1 Tax=Nocardiopsis synnemataformans TaxID=61305 RepID=UPI003EB96182
MTHTRAGEGTTGGTDPLNDFDPFAGEVLSNVEDTEDRTSLAMFEEDTSTLHPEQRRCLHALLKHRYISAESHPEQWAALITHQDLIKSRLNDLFLELHVDRNYHVAFKRQATTEAGDPLPSLLRDMAHSKEETIVMMYLRYRFRTQRQEGNDIVFAERQIMLDEVADQRPEHTTHRAMDHKRANKAIDTLATAGVLLKTADPDRFRISPIIEVLLPVEKLRALWVWLITQNGAATPADQDRGVGPAELDFDSDVEEEAG